MLYQLDICETYFVKARCKTSVIKEEAKTCRFIISQSFKNILAIVNKNI